MAPTPTPAQINAAQYISNETFIIGMAVVSIVVVASSIGIVLALRKKNS